MTKKSSREIIVSLSVLIVVVAIVAAATISNSHKKKVATTDNTKDTQPSVQLSSTPAAAGSIYKNGTFAATGNYDSPGGPEDFNLKVTIKDDVIADTSATSGSKDFTSRSYQEQFISGYKQLIVGKKIDSVGNLGAIAGSSLTTQGFEQALEKIKQEAKA